jgi:hypothetical protein
MDRTPGGSKTTQAVKGGQELAASGIQVFAVRFSAELKTTRRRSILNNIARAGGTGSAFFRRAGKLQSSLGQGGGSGCFKRTSWTEAP